MAMTRERLRSICKENDLYLTPELNDKLFCNLQGFTSIASLDGYTGLTALFLDGNALSNLTGLPPLQHLRCLYLQDNALESLDGLEQLPSLETLNVSNNRLSSLDALAGCSKLATFLAAHNALSSAGCTNALCLCTDLTTVDLQENDITDADVVDALTRLPDLRCLYMRGNPVVSAIRSYRKSLITRLPRLTYLDDRPVFDTERRCAEAWSRGGLEAEQAAREEAHLEQQRSDLAAFESMQQIQREGYQKMGLPKGDTDPLYDACDDGEWEENEEPPELVAARIRLAQLQAARRGAQPSCSPCQDAGQAHAVAPTIHDCADLASMPRTPMTSARKVSENPGSADVDKVPAALQPRTAAQDNIPLPA